MPAPKQRALGGDADYVEGPDGSVWATRRHRRDADVVRRRAGAEGMIVGDLLDPRFPHAWPTEPIR